MLYYSGWLQKPAKTIAPVVATNDDGKNGFMSSVHGLAVSKGSDIIRKHSISVG